MENVRYNISPCTPEEAAQYIATIDSDKYVLRENKKAKDKSHYDIYSYTCNGSNVAVVYDVLGQVISITAPPECADELLSAFAPDGTKRIKNSSLPAQNSRNNKPQGNAQSGSAASPAQNRDRSPEPARAGDGTVVSPRVYVAPEIMEQKGKRNDRRRGNAGSGADQGAEASTDELFPQERQEKNGKPQQVQEPRRERSAAPNRSEGHITVNVPGREHGKPRHPSICFGDSEDVADGNERTVRTGTGLYAELSSAGESAPAVTRNAGRQQTQGRQQGKQSGGSQDRNGYSVKNYPQTALAGVLKRLRARQDYRVATEATEYARTPQEVKVYSVTDKRGQRVTIRYSTVAHTLVLAGKRSDLFAEIQAQISADSDYSSALEGYVNTSGGADKNVSAVQKRLRDKLPTAFEFLSEQSRIDFSYGIHDFEQTKLTLSDYSVLLVPPYRGLERFVFDLQRAEGITVKMIGQAYDKDDEGNYILKTSYQRKIGSVVYAEVMVALYKEYYSQRNFFAHSDNSDDSQTRAISDRQAAKKIFDNLLRTVEYNAKKLKEIGFSMQPKDNRS